ncbi:MAG TPA: TonB-dependent receptor plug domain-containing protein, partial [Chitinophagaceae bacterium]|nr:TonB-dependent receptor plug domain-containing protein [Chitinophagaceae bacterium]
MKILLTAKKKPLLSKALLIMKLSTVLLICFTLQVSAKGFGQNKLDLQFKKTEIATILTTIEKATSYRFLYDNSLKEIRLKINLDVKDADVKQVLDEMFKNTGLGYQFMGDNLIVIKENDDPQAGTQVQSAITGRVLGDNNTPLQGVSVQIKGTTRGTTTNEQGVYTINASENDTLVFSFVGYEPQEIAVAGKTEIDVTLALSTQSLAQVVVIGYGTQKKRDLTGSIAVISGDDVAKMPSTNPVASLQGRVAGLTIVNSGQAGSAPTVRIRGVNSTNNSDPLYVVDGILQTNIDYLNPADIETIEVLKDPSSIAIYGLQGGNGVIIITTKRAKRGETNINFTTNVGVQQVNNKIKVVDAAGFKKLYAEQLANIGAQPFDFSNYTANTNWQDEILRSAVIN